MKAKVVLFLLTCFLFTGCGSQMDTVTGEVVYNSQELSVEAESEGLTESSEEAANEATNDAPNDATDETTKEAADANPVEDYEKENMIMNGIEIMETCPVAVSAKRSDVTYGTLVHQTYFSTTTGLDRGVNILLPADYDETKEYPTLYFLHGIFGDEYSLINDNNNRIPEILGNLYADGLAKEMIVVFPNMYAASDPELKPGFTNEAVAPYDNFINDLVNDLIPYMEKHYSVLTDRESRAIAGFSMGGRETLFIGLSRPDLFAYVGAIAPAPGLTPGKDWAMNHPGQLAEGDLTFLGKEFEPTVFMVCCGDKDSVVGKFPQSYHNIFDKNNTAHVWYEVPGADHDSEAIKSGLNNFVRAIFYGVRAW